MADGLLLQAELTFEQLPAALVWTALNGAVPCLAVCCRGPPTLMVAAEALQARVRERLQPVQSAQSAQPASPAAAASAFESFSESFLLLVWAIHKAPAQLQQLGVLELPVIAQTCKVALDTAQALLQEVRSAAPMGC